MAFLLTPFDQNTKRPDIRIEVEWLVHSGQPCIRFHLKGDIKAYALPQLTAKPFRRDELWRHSCFECFIAAPGKKNYWEINAAANRHWNVYRFEDYRAGGEPDLEVTQLLIDSASSNEHEWSLTIAMPPSVLTQLTDQVEINFAAMLETKEGDLSYWSLTHTQDKPDFHHRDGFTLLSKTTPPS